MNFEDFYAAVHDGRAPFPWQREAARRLVAGEWFDAVDVPTGCGKTALLDAAVFAAAHGGRRRVFFVVDRRIVVDSAYQDALKIAKTLREAESGPLAELAATLGPLQVLRLRGGVFRDEGWVNHPERVTVALSTVDQVGSRLLFRGYGVSPREWHKHAGFMGHGALYLVDEAHISRPFVSTLRDARALGADVAVIEMTATQADTHARVLRLGEADRAHPVIQRRVGSRKLASLRQAANPKLAGTMVEAARELAGPGEVVGVVCNTVALARKVFTQLQKPAKRGGTVPEAVLLTGRIRGVERQRLLARWLPRLKAGRSRVGGLFAAGLPPTFVVATQTIEVGADLDFDALVTQAAPLSALRQRLGRLDRLGQLGEARAVIVASEADLGPKAAVYGEDIGHTWKWLHEAAAEAAAAKEDGETAVQDEPILDLSTQNLEALLRRKPAPAEMAPFCPRLTRADVDVLAQTGKLAPEVDLSPWLHGPQRPMATVQVLWRADLEKGGPEAQWLERIAMLPPSKGETVELSFGALKKWLKEGKATQAMADVEGADEEATDTNNDEDGLRGVVWRGPDDSVVGGLDVLRPGDTFVLPASVGGHDAFGWDPTSKTPVRDVAEVAAIEGQRPLTLRLWNAAEEAWLAEARPGQRDTVRAALVELFEAAHSYRSAKLDVDEELGEDEEAVEEAEARIQTALEALADHPFVTYLHEGPRLGAPSATTAPSLGRRRWPSYSLEVPNAGGCYAVGPALRDLFGTVQHGVAVTLTDHLHAVGQRAMQLVGPISDLSDEEREAVHQAASGHDLGKSFGPFQAMLYGNPIPLLGHGQVPLAKSGFRSDRARKDAYRMSHLPRGFRHELASVEALARAPALVQHLVGAHHGHGRPLFAACDEPTADGQHLGGPSHGWAARWAALNEALGYWKLAHLEGIVRAADVQVSEEENEGRQQVARSDTGHERAAEEGSIS